jgi:hypothetical protein
MIHNGQTIAYPTGALFQEPPPSKFPWNEFRADRCWQTTDGRTVVEWQLSDLPTWRLAKLASFTDAAKEAGASFPKSDIPNVQKIEDSFGKIAKEITKLSDPAYIEAKVSALDPKKLSATEYVAALSAIDSERASLPSIIARLFLECADLEDKMKSAAQKIAKQMLENVSRDIEKRVKALRADAEQLHFPIPRRPECLRQDPLPSLCRLGAQIENVNDDLASPPPDQTWRIRNLLTLAGVIKAAAPVNGLAEENYE